MQTKPEDLITDKAIDIAFGNANFGKGHTKREIVNNTVLKFAAGYATGHTAQCIVQELGLVDSKNKLTAIGREYLFFAYSGGLPL